MDLACDTASVNNPGGAIGRGCMENGKPKVERYERHGKGEVLAARRQRVPWGTRTEPSAAAAPCSGGRGAVVVVRAAPWCS